MAAENGSPEIVAFLVEKGANINYVNSFNRTALFWARKTRKSKIAAYLEEKGAVDDIEEARRLSAKHEAKAKATSEDAAKQARKDLEIAQKNVAIAEKEAAAEKIEKAADAKKASTEAKALTKQGATYRRNKDLDSALSVLNKAVLLAPNFVNARAHLCLTLLALGKREEAIAQYKAVKILNRRIASRLRRHIKASSKRKNVHKNR